MINLVVTFVVSALVRLSGHELPDQTSPSDYTLEAGDPGVESLEIDSEEAAHTPAPSART